MFLGFLCDSAGKESTCNAGDLYLIPGLGRSLEKGTASHSSILAWRIQWTVQSMRSQRVGHDCVTFTFTLDFFYILTIVNNAVVNTGIYLFELVFLFSSDKYPGVELLDHIMVLFLMF